MSELVCVKTFATREEAELAKTYLSESGIKASVFADDTGGLIGSTNITTGGVRLFVLDENAKQAAELLDVGEEDDE